MSTVPLPIDDSQLQYHLLQLTAHVRLGTRRGESRLGSRQQTLAMVGRGGEAAAVDVARQISEAPDGGHALVSSVKALGEATAVPARGREC